MPQITPITSESLQAKIRQLLPSQIGFGEDLQAQNVIVPIVDLTQTAQGSTLPQNLQQALNFGGATDFRANNSTETVANVGGFWRIFACACMRQKPSFNVNNKSVKHDGASDKILWQQTLENSSDVLFLSNNVDFIVFLRSTDTLSVTSNSDSAFFTGSVRQVADITGNLVNPTGFTFE